MVTLLFLGLNLGLYGPGVLLVREAHVRWKKGWSTLLLLGAAYGLLEEGTALNTLFNPKATVVSGFGFYGHAYGVSWVWLVGVLGIHIVLSVGVPVLLLGLALPETRGRSLVEGRWLGGVVAVYALDIVLLNYISNYPAGHLEQIGALVVAALLWLVAWRIPAGLVDPPSRTPRRRPSAFLLYGLAYIPLLVLVPAVGEQVRLPALATGLVDLLAAAALFLAVRRDIGRDGHEAHLTLLALGVVVPIVVTGLVSQLFLPVVLVLDALAALFFYALWAHYRPRFVPVVPPGALSG